MRLEPKPLFPHSVGVRYTQSRSQLKMGYYYNLARGTMEIIRLRDALSCLRDAVDRRSRRPKGRTMQPEGG